MLQQAYSIREAAALLGLHPETLRRAVRRGELTVARIGGRILRVSAIELERWWKANGGGQLFSGQAEGEGESLAASEAEVEKDGEADGPAGSGRRTRAGRAEVPASQRSLFDDG